MWSVGNRDRRCVLPGCPRGAGTCLRFRNQSPVPLRCCRAPLQPSDPPQQLLSGCFGAGCLCSSCRRGTSRVCTVMTSTLVCCGHSLSMHGRCTCGHSRPKTASSMASGVCACQRLRLLLPKRNWGCRGRTAVKHNCSVAEMPSLLSHRYASAPGRRALWQSHCSPVPNAANFRL